MLVLLPRGHTLPARTWRDRHAWLLVLLAAHVLVLPAFGLLEGWSAAGSVAVVLPALAFGLLAACAPGGRTVRASFAALGLLSCSAALVVLWHGTIEAHFHYFVVTAALALYEEWAVYGLAVGYVVLQHGLMSQIRGDAVFAHPMAMGDGPGMWSWALIHGGFILAQSVANVVSWRAAEGARQQAADALASVRHQADHDQLTGLLTRARFDVELAAALDGAESAVVGVLFVDLDDFKSVNDVLGHARGDELLVAVARRLEHALRPEDVVSRFGGDEFVVCLTASDGTEVERIADRIALALGAPLLIGDEVRSTTASIGVAFGPAGVSRPDLLLRDADAAMYAAKRDGKARRRTLVRQVAGQAGAGPPVDVPEERDRFDVADAAVADELERLLAAQAITAVYQPVVALDSGDVVGYEALARGPVGSELERPDRLFAAGAHWGRVPLLDWTCRAAALRGARGADLATGQALFVNVEPRALGHPCPDHLLPVFSGVRDDAEIVVEVTERDLTGDPARLLAAVEGLRSRGWRVALDDVGADPRSLALMPLLRPDIIKLDLRLVQQRSSQVIAEIVSAVNAEAERTRALVLAEGIETEAHLATARALGASYGQGWLFGRPGPLPEPSPTPSRLRWAPPAPSRPAPSQRPTTPYQAVTAELEVRRGDKALLLEVTRMLEDQAFRLGEGAVLASAFQDASRFTAATHERYSRLGAQAALVAALGVGMAAVPAPRVRGAAIAEDDALLHEWSVVVLGPHFAGALVAVDLGDEGPDRDRRFDFALTYDRALVVEAASTLVGRLDRVPAERHEVTAI